jgi:asparagine synthase (glutamine-hydrolysing)
MCRPPLRPGIFLSGGLDGRMILGCADQVPQLHTLTYGAANSRDVRYGRKLAQVARRPNLWVPLEGGRWVLQFVALHLKLTEGFHSWIHLHGISALEAARSAMDVSLSGWIGGSVLTAYHYGQAWDTRLQFRHPIDEAHFEQLLFDCFCRMFTWPGLTEVEARALLPGPTRSLLRDAAFDSFREELAATSHYPPFRRMDHFFIEQQDRRSLLNGIVFTRAAVDVRCPYADYDFVDYVYGLPPHIKNDYTFRKAMITRRMPALARVPNDKNNAPPHTSRLVQWQAGLGRKTRRLARHLLPGRFADASTLYADYEQYLRTDLRAWGEWLLFSDRTRDRGLFDPAAVRSLWDRHMAGHELHTIGKLAPLMTIEMVMRYLVEGDDPESLVPDHLRP